MESSMLFQFALLSEASYTDLAGINNADDLRIALSKPDLNGRFTLKQAEDFVTKWKLVDHRIDTQSGFSATLFESIVTPGQFTLAIRGTLDFSDLEADIGDLVRDGLVLDQMVDMYNYWQQLNTPEGQVYRAAKLEISETETIALAAAYAINPTVGFAYEATLNARPGIIIDNPGGHVKTVVFGDSDTILTEETYKYGLNTGFALDAGNLDVTGHSLGGHLASAFTRLFPQTNAEAVTFNGAGFHFARSNVNNLFNALAETNTSFDPASSLNIYGSRFPELITMNEPGLLQQSGSHEELFTESGSFSKKKGSSITSTLYPIYLPHQLQTLFH